MVQKLDDQPKRNIEEILPFKDYSKEDIRDAAELIE